LFTENGGKILKINNALIYNKREKVFSNFIEKFTDIRKKGSYYKTFGKLMINSLYGSMALKAQETIQYITFSEREFLNIQENTNIESFYKINECFILIIKNDYKSKNYFKQDNLIKNNKSRRNVSYAAAISSKARIKLYKALKEVIEDGGRLLYCDTDSIFAAYNKSNTSKTTKSFE